MKRILALLLTVVLLAGVTGAGALMQVASYEESVFADSDSGPVPPVESSTPETPSSTPESSAPDSVVSGTEDAAVVIPDGELTQQQVNALVAALLAELKTYEPNAPANAPAIWAAGAKLAALPRVMALRAPDFGAACSLLDTLAKATGGTSVSPVTVTDAARAAGLAPELVELSGLAAASGMNGGAPVGLIIDVKPRPTFHLPSDITGRNMVVYDVAMTLGGMPAQPPLPVTVTMPFPRSGKRSDAVLLLYPTTAPGASPTYIWPSIRFNGVDWRMTFAANAFGELVLANWVERSSSTDHRDTAEARIYDYWRDVMWRIEAAGDGGEVFTNAKSAGAKNIPTTVLDTLYGKDVTLYVEFGGTREIVLNGKKMHPVPFDKIFYTFWDLANLYPEKDTGMQFEIVPTEGVETVEGSVQTVRPTANIVQQVGGAQGTAQPPASAAESVESVASRGEESSSIAAEPAATQTAVSKPAQPAPEKKKGGIPIWTPAVIAAAALAGLGIGTFVAGQGGRHRRKLPAHGGAAQAERPPNDQGQP